MFLVIQHNGAFDKSFNLGKISGGFGVAGGGGSTMSTPSPVTAKKRKKTTIAVSPTCDDTSKLLAEFMVLNEQKSALMSTMAKDAKRAKKSGGSGAAAQRDSFNDSVLHGIEKRRKVISELLKPSSS